jgi:acyl-CoA oxidase
MPLVLSVWVDGVLSPAELATLRAHLDAQGWLTPKGQDALSAWMDADDPPTPSDLESLANRIGSVDLAGDPSATSSLTDLGLALWKAEGGEECCWSDPAAVEALRALEDSLDILGGEAARGMTGEAARAPAPDRGPPELDPTELEAFLERSHYGLRCQVRELLGRSQLSIPIGLAADEYRERVLDAVRFLADRGLGRLGYPEAYGGSGEPAAAMAVFETLAYGDLSVLVKYGVQFGLFGGSVLQLGTEGHHAEYLPRIGSLELPGCYAMTETGHGSNVRDLQTTATYDADTDELLVHTPVDGAAKDWIGNAARHGRLAAVFARLVVHGQDHGVHVVLVPIRDSSHRILSGIRIEDRGLKVGLNGVDNGRIWFDQVRVPRANLLDRFGTITDEGAYESPISSPGRRFFTMLRTLVAGRISIAAAAVSASKVGLTIAVRYADNRRQFGPKAAPEYPILDYPLVQRELLPRLATTLGLHFASRALQTSYADGGPDEDAEIEARAAGLKAYASDHCVEVLQACREVCGGQGYLAGNRFAALKADTDIFTTFEGANGVLYQLAAKGLLSRFRDQVDDLNLWRAFKYLGERAETRITELNPVVTRRTDRDHLASDDFLLGALTYREARLLRSAALRLRARLRDGIDSFHAVTDVQDHLVTLARAHVERSIYEHFLAGVAAAPNPSLSETLRSTAVLFALSRIEADRGWFLESGYIEGNKARAIRALVRELCAELRPAAPGLVKGFGIPEGLLPEIVRSVP